MARYEQKAKDGTWTFTDQPLRDCTEDDWATFYEPDEVTEIQMKTFENLLNIKIKDTFKCLDQFTEVAVKPNAIQSLSFFLTPCNNLPWGPYEVG